MKTHQRVSGLGAETELKAPNEGEEQELWSGDYRGKPGFGTQNSLLDEEQGPSLYSSGKG